jgi:hypothetical protein
LECADVHQDRARARPGYAPPSRRHRHPAGPSPRGVLVKLGGGKKSASASSLATLAKKKKAKVKVKKKRGETFVTVRLKKLKKKRKIKFKVKAKKLPTGPTTVTTQIIR